MEKIYKKLSIAHPEHWEVYQLVDTATGNIDGYSIHHLSDDTWSENISESELRQEMLDVYNEEFSKYFFKQTAPIKVHQCDLCGKVYDGNRIHDDWHYKGKTLCHQCLIEKCKPLFSKKDWDWYYYTLGSFGNRTLD